MPELRWGEGKAGRPSHYLFLGECRVGYVHRTIPDPWKYYSTILGASQESSDGTYESAMADLMERTKQMLRGASE